MVASPVTAFYLLQFTETLLTPTDISTAHHPKHQKHTVAKTLLNRGNKHITEKAQKKHSELQNIFILYN